MFRSVEIPTLNEGHVYGVQLNVSSGTILTVEVSMPWSPALVLVCREFSVDIVLLTV